MEKLRGKNLEAGCFYSRSQLPKEFQPLLKAVGKFDEVGSCFLGEGLHGVYLITANHCVRNLLPYSERITENGITTHVCCDGKTTALISLPDGYEFEVDLNERLQTPPARTYRDIFVAMVSTSQKMLPTIRISSTHRDFLPLHTVGYLVSHPGYYFEAIPQVKGPVVSKGELVPTEADHLSEHLHFTTRSEPGSSGGPIINSCGEAMAVCVQGDNPLLVRTRASGIRNLPAGSYAEPLDFLMSLPNF